MVFDISGKTLKSVKEARSPEELERWWSVLGDEGRAKKATESHQRSRSLALRWRSFDSKKSYPLTDEFPRKYYEINSETGLRTRTRIAILVLGDMLLLVKVQAIPNYLIVLPLYDQRMLFLPVRYFTIR